MAGDSRTIERTALPGVGVGHVGTTTGGQRVGVISHVNGRREIVLYDADDPDRAAYTVALEPVEAQHLADLLNATITIDHIADLERPVDGLTAARIRLPLRSTYDGRPLRDARAGTGTASIVAVIRDEQVLAAPDPDFVLHHDDVVVAVGDAPGVNVLTDLLTTVADAQSSPYRDTGSPVMLSSPTGTAGSPESSAPRGQRAKRGLTRMEWHMLALTMFFAPLAVAGLGLAVSRGFGEALIVAVLIVVAFAGRLPDPRRRNSRVDESPLRRGDDRQALDPADSIRTTRPPARSVVACRTRRCTPDRRAWRRGRSAPRAAHQRRR